MTHFLFNPTSLFSARARLGLSRNDIVIQLGRHGLEITPSTLANWEDGRTAPDADHLPTLAVVLHCSLLDFFNRSASDLHNA